MDELLYKLHTETFVLNLKNGLEQAPSIEGFDITMRDSCTLEVAVEREQGINKLFGGLSRQGIEVLSLRNKQNRLEQLFIDMLDENRNGGEA
jgi:ABC-2 type transport system ATP-binding protein